MSPTLMNADAALDRFVELTKIPGKSGDEKMVAQQIVQALLNAGLDGQQIAFDDANQRTRIPGNCGNLIVHLPGTGSGPTTMLSAHMDTVPICVGSQPVRQGDEMTSETPTGLGADDRSGCAAILTAAIERLNCGRVDLPPAVIAFFIQEEVGLEGARHLDKDLIGKVDRAFNFDGGSVDKLTNGAIGGERLEIEITGIASHAGVAPEKGASAITMASLAIADLHQRGWLGKVVKDQGVGTSNVGVINGGEATNVVTPQLTLRAEARSHDANMRMAIVAEIRQAFENAVASVCTDAGQCGQLKFDSHVDYEAFRLPEDHPSITAADAAVRDLGRTPFIEVAGGGLDANWLFIHGIESVTMGCGQCNIHTVDERLNIPDYLDACRIATGLITGKY
ncbi:MULTISPECIES: M20/M25/M40 family metallo-hydrolase [Crateriforma]|nr:MULTISPECIES: M20/M25/M40 family metallo-hydrolase [Crateriforma]